MVELIWRLLAQLLARPRIANWLINRSYHTPYLHIMSADQRETYMGRWWLLNPYDNETRESRYSWLPFAVRIHHIQRADMDRDLHDHPWDARTVILRGWYREQRLIDDADPVALYLNLAANAQLTEYIDRVAGTSARLSHGEYHLIDEVSPGGVFTLFITFRYRGTWGFLVDGKKVPWREYGQSPVETEMQEQQPCPEHGKAGEV
ncbi:hypothetical protein [Aquipseudomonas campi]